MENIWNFQDLRKKCRQWYNHKYKERPICRKKIEDSNNAWHLEEISMGITLNGNIFASNGLRKQARKMLKEEGKMFILAYQAVYGISEPCPICGCKTQWLPNLIQYKDGNGLEVGQFECMDCSLMSGIQYVSVIHT